MELGLVAHMGLLIPAPKEVEVGEWKDKGLPGKLREKERSVSHGAIHL